MVVMKSVQEQIQGVTQLAPFPVMQPPVGSVRFQSFKRHLRAVGEGQRGVLAEVAAMDHEGFWRHEGCKDMAMWLAGALGVSRFKAARMVAAAHALEELPHTAAALARGEIELDKVLELARFATRDDEARLLVWAGTVSLRRVRERGDEVLEERASARSVELDRRLGWSWSPERDRIQLYGEFPGAEGTQIVAALDRVAKTIPELPSEERPEWMDAGDVAAQKRADALWLLAATSPLGGTPKAPEVVAHTGVGLASGERSELAGGHHLHLSTAARLACDCRLRFVLHDDDGDALGIGDASRTPPRWIDQEVRRRDCYRCTFPGCHHRYFVQSHHITGVTDGGPTELGNLVTACAFHHKLLHEYGWSVELTARGARWLRPDGTPYDPRATLRAGP